MFSFRMFAWFFVFVCASAAEQTMTGEPRRVPVNDTRVLTAAHFAVAEFNKVNAGEMFAYKTVAITSAKIQVVAGIKYILDMLLGQTVCSRNHAAADSEPCAFQSRRKEYQCHFVVVEVPWEKSRVLSKNECHQNKS
ncbi:cystatin-SA [Haplochromis burtoni]|uniref:cystatin-SA n=1 Tax=Haplochromis burtoni TaxID=8153 RepID=UPI0003BC6FEB|nr:cystatin-SA [Haplochromis burtoni]